MASKALIEQCEARRRPHRNKGRRLASSLSGDLMREHLPLAIRSLRERRQLTQGALASASGLSRAFINRIESGRFSMTLETFGALADALSVRPAVLLSMAYGTEPRDES